jgi:hypothetical protein
LQYRISNSKRFQAAVDAIVDDFTAVPYTGIGGTTTSVLNNDTLNGVILNQQMLI